MGSSPTIAKSQSASRFSPKIRVFARQAGLTVLQTWRRDIAALNIRRLGVAISGGADSTALAALIADLRGELGLDFITLIHLDHGIRSAAECARERCAARELARTLGLPPAARRVRVRTGPGGLELAARRARLDYFGDQARRLELDAVATGHHLRDRAETLLMFLMRGAGSRGMSSLRSVERIGRLTLVRPLIDCSPEQLRAFLAVRRIGFVEDRSNRARRFTRNRIRLDLLPLMERIRPGATVHLAEAARILQDESHALQLAAAAAFDNLTLKSRTRQNLLSQGVVLSRPGLARLPAALAARVIQLLLRTGDAQVLRAAVKAAGGTEHQRFDIPGGRRLCMKSGRIWVESSACGRKPRRE